MGGVCFQYFGNIAHKLIVVELCIKPTAFLLDKCSEINNESLAKIICKYVRKFVYVNICILYRSVPYRRGTFYRFSSHKPIKSSSLASSEHRIGTIIGQNKTHTHRHRQKRIKKKQKHDDIKRASDLFSTYIRN